MTATLFNDADGDGARNAAGAPSSGNWRAWLNAPSSPARAKTVPGMPPGQSRSGDPDSNARRSVAGAAASFAFTS